MTIPWDDAVADWWVEEVASDPVYAEEVIPLALAALAPVPGGRYLELGCGEGEVMRAAAARGAGVLGCDLSERLARRAAGAGPVAVCRLPDLSWVRPGSLDGALAVLVVEHLAEAGPLFAAAAAAVRPGGVLAMVANHPAYTAPGSGPLVDPDDGEVLWRWGPYMDEGSSEEPAGKGAVTFHHRSLGQLLTAVAAAGWCLESLVEHGVGERRAAEDPLLAAQRQIPRLLAARWVRR
jgi:SAM-dependent methyltransferase